MAVEAADGKCDVFDAKHALYFGGAEERSARGVNSIRENGGSMPGPQVRRLRSERGKMLELSPKGLTLSSEVDESVFLGIFDGAVRLSGQQIEIYGKEVQLKGAHITLQGSRKETLVTAVGAGAEAGEFEEQSKLQIDVKERSVHIRGKSQTSMVMLLVDLALKQHPEETIMVYLTEAYAKANVEKFAKNKGKKVTVTELNRKIQLLIE